MSSMRFKGELQNFYTVRLQVFVWSTTAYVEKRSCISWSKLKKKKRKILDYQNSL